MILQRTLPDAQKLAIAKKIENNLFSKVNSMECCINSCWKHKNFLVCQWDGKLQRTAKVLP